MTVPVVGIGASAGGVRALMTLTKALPRDLPAELLAVCHTSPGGPGRLAEVLEKHSRVPVRFAEQGLEIEAGTLYTAVPDRHLMLEGDRLRLTRGAKENRTRPTIDVLFRSVAPEVAARRPLELGLPSSLTCPECGGVMAEIREALGHAIDEPQMIGSQGRSRLRVFWLLWPHAEGVALNAPLLCHSRRVC